MVYGIVFYRIDLHAGVEFWTFLALRTECRCICGMRIALYTSTYGNGMPNWVRGWPAG